MVLRYKALVAAAIAVFAVVWLRQIEAFPLSSLPMYSYPARGNPVDYINVRDEQGNILDDKAMFYVALYRTGDEVASPECFGGRAAVCHDYFTMVAQRLQQNITIEHWQWNYKTGARALVARVVVACGCG